MSRFLALLFGIFGALGSSQGPGFTQQYVQNLTGRVDELRMIVERFDGDMASLGLSRQEGLAQCQGGETVPGKLCDGMRGDVIRYEALSTQLALLATTSEWQRPIMLARYHDEAVARSTLEAYEPAVPATPTGAGYAAAGFALLWGLASMLLGLATAPFRRY